MLPRFFVPDLDPSSRTATLPADEGRHLVRVLRMRPGDEISVFDGQGCEFVARIIRVERDRVEVSLHARVEPAAEPAVPFALVQAVLKGNKMDDVVRDATMMGARAIVPVLSEHVAVKSSVIRRAEAAVRWERIAVASAKQSGRAHVPRIAEPAAFTDWLAASVEEARLLFVEPGLGSEAASSKALLDRPKPASAALIVGPEGGWSRAEVDAAVKAGCAPVSLGRLTLRADAMTVAAIAVCRFLWESDGT